jgi:LemA protein
MYPVLMIAGGIGFIALIWFIVTYNTLIRYRNHVTESWSDVDTELQRRYDLIPNLVSTVKGYAAHEKSIMEEVTRLRGEARENRGTPASQAHSENSFVSALGRLVAVAENYPELKADKNYLALQDELTNTEDRIQVSRRFYNGNVRDMNNQVQMFPSSLVAGMFGFELSEFFELREPAAREAPKVD